MHPNTFVHGESPSSGQAWMTAGVVSFDKLKVSIFRWCGTSYMNDTLESSPGDQQSCNLVGDHRKIRAGVPSLDAQVRPPSPRATIGRRRDGGPRPLRPRVIGGAASRGWSGNGARETRWEDCSAMGCVIPHPATKWETYLHRIFTASEDTLRLIDESKATTFVFPETVFTTVTAYQNQQVSDLCRSQFNIITENPGCVLMRGMR